MTVSLEAIELLTERTDWVRALARRLVGDAHLAEDVAQEATLAALRAAPRAHRIGPAWLAGIVRNVAADVRRGGARRARHERQNARPGEAPSAMQAAAFVEQQRLLADVVLALEPPFRDVVLLRFFEDLPRRAIARRLDIPVATVNSRLARAMAKLRARLDARHDGERSTWVAALAPLALRAPALGGLTLGALVMKNKVMAAAILVALVGAGTWLAGGFAAPTTTPPAVVPVVQARDATVVASETPPASAAPTRAELTTPAPVAVDSGPRVQVVDALTGTPEPDADVRLLSPNRNRLARQLERGDIDDLDVPFQVGERLTVDGAASLPLPTERPAVLFARHGERMGVLELRDRDGDQETLRLWPVHSVRAHVVDAHGRAAHGVPVVLRLAQPGQAVTVNLQNTDAEGTALLRWFEPMRDIGGTRGRLEAALGFPGGESVATAIEVEPSVVDVRLSCPAVGRVNVALHALDPVLPADIGVALTAASASTAGGPWTKALADGRAEFWPVGVGTKLRAVAWYRNRSFTLEADGPTFAGETVTLTIDVGQSLTLVGRILTNGQPRANTRVSGKLVGDGEDAYLILTTDDEGRFRTEFAATARATVLELSEHNGPNSGARLEVPLPALGGAQPIDLGDLDLTAVAPIAAGNVVDAEGEPVANASVAVLTETDATSTGWDTRLLVASDAEGRFAVPDTVGAGEFWLQARRPGPWRHEPQRCVPGARDLQLVLQRAGQLAGRIRAGAGVPLEQLHANLWDERAGPPPLRDTRGWTIAGIDADGHFRFDGVRPGSYTLMLSLPSRRLDEPLATIAGIAVGLGDVTRDARLSPLDLSGTLRALTLRVHDEDGQPLRADTFAILGTGPDRHIESLGWTDRPLLLATDDAIGTIFVEADGYFAARIDAGAAEGDVVLRRGVPVAVQIDGAPALEPPFALRASLEALTPTAATKSARGYRQRLRPDHAFVAQGGDVALRVPLPGDYRLRLVVQRDEGGYLDEVDVTPEPAPVARVGDSEARLAATADPASIAAAVAKIGARKR